MASLRARTRILLTIAVLLALPVRSALAETFLPWIKPEQKQISVRQPSQLPHIALPSTPRPPTVSDLQWDGPVQNLSLDEAIRAALSNSEVIRVLGGVTAVRSGSTIYDVAITNAGIDVAQGVFDPLVSVNNAWNHIEVPFALPDPGDPTRTLIDGTRSDSYDLNFQLAKTNLAGGTWALGVTDDTVRRPGSFPLDPQNSTSLNLSYSQPLFRGAGLAANQVPIVLARINTERSYFQYKSSVQQLVRDVIGAYWALVATRTALWAREQQVIQAEFAVRQAVRREAVGLINAAELSQSQSALANFRSSLIAAKAEVLQREAALRSILGQPAYDPQRITPVTTPSDERLEFEWESIVALAEEYRPDLVELKLILEADQQNAILARNLAKPQVDAFGLYRWNGLEGVMPIGDPISSPLSRNTDWTLGINFSVPIGLRAARAQLRQAELIIARDRANLTQGLLTVSHLLAANLRNLDLFYEQYQATRETRAASRVNLNQQLGSYASGLTQFIDVLQAIVSWGDSVSSEAQLLSQYNAEQANLQLETGTILETHGVFFYEERFRSIGPLGCLAQQHCYPRAKPPTGNEDFYPTGDRPAEEFFDLSDPIESLREYQRRERETLPPLRPLPPTESTEPPPPPTPSTFELLPPSGISTDGPG